MLHTPKDIKKPVSLVKFFYKYLSYFIKYNNLFENMLWLQNFQYVSLTYNYNYI